LDDCCAWATAPHVMNVITRAISLTSFRFWLADLGFSEGDFEGNAFICLISWVSIENPKLVLNPSTCLRINSCEESLSFDDFVRPRQHVRRNGQADLLGSLEINEQLEFGRLLDGKIGRLGSFKNPVHVISRALS
jgi:hypothetical protein